MRLAYALLPLVLLVATTPVRATCPPEGWNAGQLQALRESGFKVEDAARRDELALGLLDCLGDADPVVRDGTAFEGLSRWMREKSLSPATLAQIRESLQPELAAAAPDDELGVRQPFAALVMSEVARTDRVEPWLTPEQRAGLVSDAATFLSGVRDYRGFVDGQGWRHGVAHGSDVALQLVVNPAIDRAQVDTLLAAVRAQVVAADGHAYIHGEPGRLARVVYFAAQRNLHDRAYWDTWLKGTASPGPLESWNAAFTSEAGLARLHDTRLFLQALLVLVVRSDEPELRDRLQPAVLAALAPIP
ncbi:MAG: DUF2785 domain-containing protein [Arenimonas sp.]